MRTISPLGEYRWARVMAWEARQLREKQTAMQKQHTTDFLPISSEGKRRYMAWNPEITLGNVVAIVIAAIGGLGAFYSLKETTSNLQIQVEALKAKDAEMTARGNERYADLRTDIKDMKQAINDMALQIARYGAGPVAQQQVVPRITNNLGR